MIKCNVTVCGTVIKSAEIRTNSEGTQFISFKVSVPIPASEPTPKFVDISIIKEGNDITAFSKFPPHAKVQATGTLTFTQKNNNLYWNMRAETVSLPEQDPGITGKMDFWGTTGKQIEEKVSKNEKKYLSFAAYSAQKEGDNLAFQWVRFLDFSGQRPEWLIEKTSIKVSGKLDISMFNGHLDLKCFVTEITKWNRRTTQSETQPQ